MRYALPDGQTVRIDQEFEMGDVRYPSNWLRSSNSIHNANGNTMVFAAYAENPFKYARAR